MCFAESKNAWPMGEPIPAQMGDDYIPTVRSAMYLGHELADTLNDSQELIRVSRAFNSQFHAFFNRFNGLKDVELLKFIFNTFCTSFYGIEGVDSAKVSSHAVRFWRKSVNLALMKLLKLPPESVSPFLFAEGILNADTVWKLRSALLWKGLLKSKYHFSKYLLQMQSDRIQSICSTYDMNSEMLKNASFSFLHSKSLENWREEKDVGNLG